MICSIVLAAGQSRRMGTQKLLLPFAGSTMIGHILSCVLRSPVQHTVVVVGHGAAAVSATVQEFDVAVVTNDYPDGDMLSSIRCGLRALPPGYDAVLVVLGDQPSVTVELITQLIDAYSGGHARIVVPTYEGRRGHPMLLAAAFRDEVLGRYDGVGLRGLLESHAEDVLEVPVADDGVVSDVDVPDDYRRAVKKLTQRQPRGGTAT